MRSMRTMRSMSASRLPPFSLILKRIRPSRSNPLLERVRQAVVDPRRDVARLERVAGADRMEHRHLRRRPRRHVAIEILAFERRPEIVRQVAAHERARRRCRSSSRRLPCRTRRGWRRRTRSPRRACRAWGSASAASAAVRRRRRRGGTAARATRKRSMGWPLSSHAAVWASQRRRERPHGAEARVLRGGGEGPRVAERHRAESPGVLAVARADAAVDVEDA